MNFSQVFDLPNIPSYRRVFIVRRLPRVSLREPGYTSVCLPHLGLAHPIQGRFSGMRVLPDYSIPRWVYYSNQKELKC